MKGVSRKSARRFSGRASQQHKLETGQKEAAEGWQETEVDSQQEAAPENTTADESKVVFAGRAGRLIDGDGRR